MPPTQLPSPVIDTDHMLPPARKQPAGPIAGIIVIVVLMALGALYFWGAYLNRPSANAPSPITQN